MTRVALAVLFFALLVPVQLAPTQAWAMAIDVSEDNIRVTTGFNGTSLVVFGTHDKPGSVVVVVEGPPRTMTVRRKSRVLGLWTNTDSRKFVGVPGFYEVAAAGPLDIIATPETLAKKRIGLGNLEILSNKGQKNDEDTRAFLDALFEHQKEKKLFVEDVQPLAYPGPMLFKARIEMPAVVSPGQYKVSAYLFQDGRIVEEDSAPFVVVPEGTSADLRRFATQNGLLYGLVSMLAAVFAGWLATVLLKRE